jgi:hypothetical protein
MDFGRRNIRSAGRSSGSIEVTLPVELAVLEGIACRLSLRDGLAPEIVLQPDLQVVMPVFEKLWDLLRLGLEEIGEIGDFGEADYGFGLFRASKLGTTPSLVYTDALSIHRSLGTTVDATPQVLEAFARIIESMAAVAGSRLGLSNERAALFGNEVAYLVSGEMIGARDAFARSLAAQSSSTPRDAGWCRRAPLSTDNWRRAQNALMHAYDQFRSWDNDPAVFTKERELWYRARHFEAQFRATQV